MAVVAVVVRAPATAAPPAGVSVMETEAVDRDPLKVTPTVEANATPVALAAGVVDATLTGLAGVRVVNVDVNGAIAVPPGLDALAVTVYELVTASAADGVKVATGALNTNAPGTPVPPGPVTVTDTDDGFTRPENVTLTGLVTATPVAPDAGLSAATEGAMSPVVVNTTSTK